MTKWVKDLMVGRSSSSIDGDDDGTDTIEKDTKVDDSRK